MKPTRSFLAAGFYSINGANGDHEASEPTRNPGTIRRHASAVPNRNVIRVPLDIAHPFFTIGHSTRPLMSSPKC